MPRGPEGGLGDAAQNANFVAQVEAQVAQMRAQEAEAASQEFFAMHQRSASRRHGG